MKRVHSIAQGAPGVATTGSRFASINWGADQGGSAGRLINLDGSLTVWDHPAPHPSTQRNEGGGNAAIGYTIPTGREFWHEQNITIVISP